MATGTACAPSSPAVPSGRPSRNTCAVCGETSTISVAGSSYQPPGYGSPDVPSGRPPPTANPESVTLRAPDEPRKTNATPALAAAGRTSAISMTMASRARARMVASSADGQRLPALAMIAGQRPVGGVDRVERVQHAREIVAGDSDVDLVHPPLPPGDGNPARSPALACARC